MFQNPNFLAFVVERVKRQQWRVEDDVSLKDIFNELKKYAKANHDGPGKCKDPVLQHHKDFCSHLNIGTSGSLEEIINRLKKHFKKTGEGNKAKTIGKTISKTIGKTKSKESEKAKKSTGKKTHALKNGVSANDAAEVMDIKVGDVCHFKNGDKKELKKTESGDYRWSKVN